MVKERVSVTTTTNVAAELLAEGEANTANNFAIYRTCTEGVSLRN
jgi:hypothetical protein